MNDGAISVLVLYTDVPVYETKVPLCATVPCPVSPGPVNVTYSQTLPGVAPPARGQRVCRALPSSSSWLP